MTIVWRLILLYGTIFAADTLLWVFVLAPRLDVLLVVLGSVVCSWAITFTGSMHISGILIRRGRDRERRGST